MKIKLIAPARKPEWGESFWDLKTLCRLTGKKAGGAPLALPTLAALTPADIEVILTDENVEAIDFEERVDLVGITGMTCVIQRSYEIADAFRKRGIPVILGGIHASMLADEALQHADSVAVGEAEALWGAILDDARKGTLKRIYRACGFPDLTSCAIPRWDLLKNDRYCYFTVQTGRGCPYDCDFCSVKVFNGREYRHKPLDVIVKEIQTLQQIDPHKLIFFTDDNLLAVPQYAQELMHALLPLKIKNWMCQSSLNRINNDSLLSLMQEAGCKVIFIGFESISQHTIDAMNKGLVNHPSEFSRIIEKVHSHKIAAFGSFILGADTDTPEIFGHTIDFIEKNSIGFSMINILTLLPGTRLYDRLKSENRILPFQWWQSNADWACYSPKQMTKDELERGHRSVLQQIYSYPKLYGRLRRLWDRGIFLRGEKKNRYSKTRIFFSFASIIRLKIREISFVLKSLWYKQCTSILWVLTAVNYHNYAFKMKKKAHV